MNAPYLHYTFLKKVTDGLDLMIKKEIEYDDDLIFNYSGFNLIGNYYSLKSFKDKYNFSSNLKNNFNEFITECIINLDKHNDYKDLYFLYSLVSNYTLDIYLDRYIESVKSEKISADEIYRMIDFSIASKDNIDISKNNLYKKFKNSFIYYDYMDELIHFPCIRIFKFMASKEYFKKCYKKKKKYFKKYTKLGLSYPLHVIVSKLAKSDKKLAHFIYKDKRDIDLTLISDDLINNAYNDVKNKIKAINSYLYDDKDKDLRKIFNIPEDKKI